MPDPTRNQLIALALIVLALAILVGGVVAEQAVTR